MQLLYFPLARGFCSRYRSIYAWQPHEWINTLHLLLSIFMWVSYTIKILSRQRSFSVHVHVHVRSSTHTLLRCPSIFL